MPSLSIRRSDGEHIVMDEVGVDPLYHMRYQVVLLSKSGILPLSPNQLSVLNCLNLTCVSESLTESQARSKYVIQLQPEFALILNKSTEFFEIQSIIYQKHRVWNYDGSV